MKLEHIIQSITVNKLVGDVKKEVSGIQIDSRLIQLGDVFVAIKGTQTDGHNYIDKAIEKGANSIICEVLPFNLEPNVTYVEVDNCEAIVGPIATSFYNNPTSKLKLVGVTGTNGKTTIATLLYDTFRKLGYKVGLISTVCNRINGQEIPTEHTTPDPITLNKLLGEMVDNGCEYAFMEVSSHSVVQQRIGGLVFAGAIFTNLTRDHLDYHQTVENYLKAKKKFFDDLPKEAFALTNLDDKNGLVMTQNTQAKIASYSLRSLSDYKAKVLEDTFEGMLLDINNTEVHVQFIGRFNAANLLAVYGAACLLGQKPEEVL
ncbi:MAG: UDP-N-acetylmuramoyl-L-alanyl-D-glutamate--2,6-diaminopimelate ligase, partial [Phocaeicola sp.]